MSSINLSDLLAAINEGEQAKAAVPALQAQISDLQRKLDAAQGHSQELETNIIGYKQTIDGLNEKVRSLVVERDDASFRGLEAEERIASMLNALRAVRADVLHTVDRLDPPKAPEPAPSPVQSTEMSMTEVQPFPTSSPAPVADIPAPVSGSADASATSSGQSEASPTVASTASTDMGSAMPTSSIAPTPAVEQQAVAFTQTDLSPSLPNLNRPYHEKPDTTTWADWIASGGEKAPWL